MGKYDTSPRYSSATVPQTNCQIEVVNRTLGNLLRSICGDMPRTWDQVLSQVEFAYNNTINNITGMPPFSIVYQKVLHHLLDLAKFPIGEKFSSAASVMAEQTIDVQKEVRTRLEKSKCTVQGLS